MNLDKTKKQVEYCLEKFPATRNSDMYLVLSVWKNFHKKKLIDFIYVATKSLGKDPSDWMISERDDLRDLPNFESIRRTRAKIQNEELRFLASDEVQQMRKIEEEKSKQWART